MKIKILLTSIAPGILLILWLRVCFIMTLLMWDGANPLQAARMFTNGPEQGLLIMGYFGTWLIALIISFRAWFD